MQWSRSPHRPPHLYVDNAWYFITASTANRKRILLSDKHFEIWIQALHELVVEFNATLMAWVVLANHYHFLFLPQRGLDLGSFIKKLHGRTARQFNLLDASPRRTVWYSYWDTCIRGERDFWTRFNYIHYNPIKHGYVKQLDEWRFSSFHQYVDSQWLKACVEEFPAPAIFDNDIE